MDYIKNIRNYLDTTINIHEISVKKPKIKVKIGKENLNVIEPKVEIDNISDKVESQQEQIGLVILQDIDFEKTNRWLKEHKEDKLLVNNLIQIKILVKLNRRIIPTFPIEVSTIESWSRTIKNLIETEIKIPRKFITKILPFKTIGNQYYYIVFVKQHKTNYNIVNSLNWLETRGSYQWEVKSVIYRHSEYEFEIETIQDLFNYLNEIEKEKLWINRNYSIENSHNIIGLNEILETLIMSV